MGEYCDRSTLKAAIMKSRTKIFILGFILLACVVLLVIFWPSHKPQPGKVRMTPLVVDRTTWELKDPENPTADLKKYNTPEAKEQRRKAVNSFESPEEYRKQYPLTPEQKVQGVAARRAIVNPPRLDEIMRTKTPEERKAFEESLKGMLNPAPPK